MLGADVLVLKEGPCRERIWDSGNIPPSVLNLELGKLRALAVLKQRKDPSLSLVRSFDLQKRKILCLC